LLLLQNALIASDGVIIPLEAGYYEISGMVKFSETIADVKSMPNPNLKIMGLLAVKYDGRINIDKELVEGLPIVAEQMGTIAFDTTIRKTVEVKNAQKHRLTIHEFNPTSTAAIDYMALVDELEKRGMI
jgi:chromosome partitioning protein